MLESQLLEAQAPEAGTLSDVNSIDPGKLLQVVLAQEEVLVSQATDLEGV